MIQLPQVLQCDHKYYSLQFQTHPTCSERDIRKVHVYAHKLVIKLLRQDPYQKNIPKTTAMMCVSVVLVYVALVMMSSVQYGHRIPTGSDPTLRRSISMHTELSVLWLICRYAFGSTEKKSFVIFYTCCHVWAASIYRTRFDKDIG